MKKICFKLVSCLLFIVLPFLADAQKEGANWRFGNKAGLDFSGGTPQYVSNSKLVSDEGCSAISDSLGNLLFYTNGRTIWNTDSDTIAENLKCCTTGDIGIGLYRGTSSTQGVLMLSGANELYWLFTISDSLKAPNYDPYISTYLRYHIVDKKKNNGKGQIIKKNVIAYDIGARSEKLAAVRHANGRDWWLVVQNHKNGLDYYYKFIFEPNNNNLSFHNLQIDSSTNDKPFGQATFNRDGNKLAVAKYSHLNERLLLWDFNRCTGELHDKIDLTEGLQNDFFWPYGVAFSAKNTKLYAANPTTNNTKIIQFDLNNPNIINSHETVYSAEVPTNVSLFGMQLAPDDKIYFSFAKFPANVSDSLNNHLSIITKPEESGTLCGVMPHSFYLGPGSGLIYGLPNIPNYALGPLYAIPLSDAGPDKCITPGTPTQIGTPPVPGTLYRWRPTFGLSDSTAAQPTVAPDVTTTYTLSVINEAGDSCYFNRDIVTVYVPQFPTNFSTLIDHFNANFSTNGNDENLTYFWKFGDGDSSFLKSPAHIYPDTGTYTVTLLLTDTLSGCQKTLVDTLHIGVSSIVEDCQMNETKFSIYPNPAQNIVSVEVLLPPNTEAKLTVRNALGAEVHTSTLMPGAQTLNVTNWSAGIYLCTFEYQGKRFTHKLLIAQ